MRLLVLTIFFTAVLAAGCGHTSIPTRWKERSWRCFYLCLVIYFALSGYVSLAPRTTVQVGMPWWFSLLAFLFFSVVPVALTASRLHSGVETVFRRPSLNRSPFSKVDILQHYRLLSVCCAMMALGACFGVRHAEGLGRWLFWSYLATSAGLLMGERIVYLVYAKRII
jgi:hypothetical protein